MNVANSIFTPKHRKERQQQQQNLQSPRKSQIQLKFSEAADQGDTETNFQIASTVIEAGATVYSMRVQSLYTETDKMRDKLAASNKKLASRGNNDDVNDDVSGNDSEAERIFGTANGGDPAAKRIKRKAMVATLTTDEKISARGIDMNLEPDPLFNKNTEIYMMGGCQRLLLGRADTLAGRTILLEPTRDDAESLYAMGHKKLVTTKSEKNGGIDGKNEDFTAKSDDVEEGDMPIERGCLTSLVPGAVNSIELCPLIREYSWDAVFGPSKVPDIDISDNMEPPLAEDFTQAQPPPPQTPNEDDIFEGVAPADDYSDRDDDADFIGPGDADDDVANINNEAPNLASTPPIDPNDKVIQDKVPIHDDNGNENANNANGTTEDYFFFDPKLMLNWAGPDHWKFPTLKQTEARRARPQDTEGDNGGNEGEQPPPKKRGRKKDGSGDGCFIDFTSQAKFDPKLFEPPAKASTTLSDAALKKHTALATTLPPDIHYDVSMLSRLFLNPSWQFSERRNPVQSVQNSSCQSASGDLERLASQEWYEYNSQPVATDGDAFGGGVNGAGIEDDDDNNADFGMPSSFGDDNIGSLDSLGAGISGSQAPILTTLIAAPPQLKIGHVNFTKEMRVVDVGLIKRTLWKHLSDTNNSNNANDEEADEQSEKKNVGNGEVTKSFKEVLTEISNDLPRDTMEDLTVSFCFMCVLHLCNEKSMHITVDKETNDLIIHRPVSV